jgi:hypothetical protein
MIAPKAQGFVFFSIAGNACRYSHDHDAIEHGQSGIAM